MIIIGEKLRSAREKAGLSAASVAAVADLTPRRIFQIETDGVSHVNDNVGRAICEYIGVKPEDI